MTVAKPPTKPGTKRLSDVARILVAPTEITSTGWPSVRDTCETKLGVAFDSWQHGAGRLILAKRADGRLAATIDGVGMSLPRQVGKTYLIGAMIFALCVERPGLLVIWSAHHARTHGETFLAMQSFAGRAKVKAHVAQIFVGSGDEEIRFHNGSRILFGARERGFGRGIPGVDALVLDEAQICSDKALANMLATLNTSDFGLHLYIGTPPRPEDNSEAFRRMRSDALEGRLTDGAWIEFGADPDSKPDDRRQWAKANPSYPKRTPAESIMRLQRKLTPEDFLREGMGIWDGSINSLAMPSWPLCATSESPGKPLSLGLAMDIDRVWLSLAASMEGDGPHLGAVLRVRVDSGRAKMLTEAHRLAKKHGIPVIIAGGGPADSLVDDLEALGLVKDRDLYRIDFPQYAIACADLFDAVEAKEVAHGGYDELDAAVSVAGWRRSTGDRRVWSRKNGDISMLEAATLAFWGANSGSVSVHSPEAYAF